MSRVSRVNVDVTATTTGLEAGMRRAEARVEGFGKRVDGMKQSFEKLRGVVGFGLAGFGVAFAVENTIGQVWKFARGIEAASDRATKALEELRKAGTPLSASGLSPTTARSLQAVGPAAADFNRRASFGALFDTAVGEAVNGKAMQAGDFLRGVGDTSRAFAAILGSGINQVQSGRLQSAFSGTTANADLQVTRILSEVVGAVGEAVTPDDQVANVAIGRAFLRTISDSTFRSLFLGRGAR